MKERERKCVCVCVYVLVYLYCEDVCEDIIIFEFSKYYSGHFHFKMEDFNPAPSI